MSDPVVFDAKPVAVELEKGEERAWCGCGRSSNQPYCDGSHRGTGLEPLTFTAQETGEAYLCLCKQTKNPPFCDGSHNHISPDEIGKEKPVPESGKVLVPRATPEEPTVAYIHELAENGLDKTGHHGPMGSMGVPRSELPSWDDIQLLECFWGVLHPSAPLPARKTAYVPMYCLNALRPLIEQFTLGIFAVNRHLIGGV